MEASESGFVVTGAERGSGVCGRQVRAGGGGLKLDAGRPRAAYASTRTPRHPPAADAAAAGQEEPSRPPRPALPQLAVLCRPLEVSHLKLRLE
ncbi:hypothetical protein BDA96_02G070400 [Sorghum bicolor]|uniref:Uncharacterized protein n=2 Tax=Sorghum bicolor TaxID=4558 RepID=A0A921RLW7_SORBI|nr:hypothetical protein BDA96_02G070400 [Sorghum bicolor]OQU88653.1 hypothetical protein SORBI_3002G069050 [Sorghum bicolor]